MGLIIKDHGIGLHAESRRESFIVYTDHGDDRIELPWKLLEEADFLIQALKTAKPGKTPAIKARADIQAMIDRIERDDRYKYQAAHVQINAPLALIQVEMKAQVRALKWVLGIVDHIGTSAAE